MFIRIAYPERPNCHRRCANPSLLLEVPRSEAGQLQIAGKTSESVQKLVQSRRHRGSYTLYRGRRKVRIASGAIGALCQSASWNSGEGIKGVASLTGVTLSCLYGYYLVTAARSNKVTSLIVHLFPADRKLQAPYPKVG